MSTPGAGRVEQLPLFPLGTVLTPGMALSLHVFEPRYRKLVADLLNDQDPRAPEFGVVTLRSGWEVGELGDVHEVGTAARVTDVLPLADGRCDLSAIGERRFAIEELDTASRPYLMATVRWLPEPDGQLSPGLLLGTQRAIQRHRSALARLNLNYAEPEGDAEPEGGAEPEGDAEPTGAEAAGSEAAGSGARSGSGTPSGSSGPAGNGAPAGNGGPAGAGRAELDATAARALSYAVARQSWLPLADRQRLLACPDTATRLREARAILRRESELVWQLRAVPVTAAAFRS